MSAKVLPWGTQLYFGGVSPRQFRDALRKLGLSQSEAARRLYVQVSTVQRWVRGERKIPGPVVACLESWERERRALDALSKRKKPDNT